MVNGRIAGEMSKVSEFCLQKVLNLHVNAFNYSLPGCIIFAARKIVEFEKNACILHNF